jgi:hypothetical protein
MQSSGLVERHQALGFAAQLASQLGKPVSTGGNMTPAPSEFVIAGVDSPGTEGSLVLVSLVDSLGNPDPELVRVLPGEGGSPTNLAYPAPYNNLGVAGATVAAMLQPIAGIPSFDLVLRDQGSMVAQAGSLNPTFVALWAGVSDVMQRVVSGQDLTAVLDFRAALQAVVDSILAFDPEPGIVMANIPDLTRTPYAGFVPPVVVDPQTGQPVLDQSGRPVRLIGIRGPLRYPGLTGPNSPGDLVTINAIPLLDQGIGIPQQLGGTDLPLPEKIPTGTGTDSVTVLIFEEDVWGTSGIRPTTLEYNSAIAEIAGANGIPVVDMWSVNNSFFNEGFVAGGVEYNSEYISGGIYSLDGIHYTDLAQAMVANEFIRVINGQWGSSIPEVGLAPLMGTK